MAHDRSCAAFRSTARIGDALVVASDAENFERHGSGDGWDRLRDVAGICRTWGDCYGYALVATGRAEAMIDPVLSVWGAAAMLPIVREAGGVVTGLNAVTHRAGSRSGTRERRAATCSGWSRPTSTVTGTRFSRSCIRPAPRVTRGREPASTRDRRSSNWNASSTNAVPARTTATPPVCSRTPTGDTRSWVKKPSPGERYGLLARPHSLTSRSEPA
jgi:hypothetical protein